MRCFFYCDRLLDDGGKGGLFLLYTQLICMALKTLQASIMLFCARS